jgi:hypothetical protein
MGKNIKIIKKITEVLLGASKEVGLDINADKTKYIVLEWRQEDKSL